MGLNLKRPNYRPLVFLCTLAAILICAEYSLHLMQKFKRFVLVLHEVLAEFRPSISHNITDVRLLLWTRKSPLKYNYLYIGDTVSLSTCGFDRSKETKILIHGFSDQGLTGWVKNFKKFYLDRGDYNIISVSCTHICAFILKFLETCVKKKTYVHNKLHTLRSALIHVHHICLIFCSNFLEHEMKAFSHSTKSFLLQSHCHNCIL